MQDRKQTLYVGVVSMAMIDIMVDTNSAEQLLEVSDLHHRLVNKKHPTIEEKIAQINAEQRIHDIAERARFDGLNC